LAKRAQGGEDFAKLAKEFSQDTGSAVQGGDLGFSERKAWVTPFADAAFSMKEGEIRGPVKTQFGYHILKLEGIQPTAVKSFDQARAELETEYRRNEAERLFNNVHDIPEFSRVDGGGDLGKAAPVLESAFSQDVLDGRLSPIVEVEKGRGVVLRATDHKLPQQKPFDSVRTLVVAAWKKQRGTELAAAAAADAVKRLTAGEAWETVAKTLSASPPPAKFVARGDQAVPLDVRRVAFEVPKPDPKPEYRTFPLTDGDAAVLAVTALREDPAVDTKDGDGQLRRQFAQQWASGEAQSYAAAARADAKVTVNPQALD